MKAIVLVALCFMSVTANIFDDAIDIDKKPLLLKNGASAWFKVAVTEHKTWHAESDNPNLKFSELGGMVFGNYQYFHLTCRRGCAAGQSFPFTLTETLDSS